MSIEKFRAQRNIWGDAVEIFAYGESKDGTRIVAQPTVLNAMTREEYTASVALVDLAPWITIPNEAAQRLMDELWHTGFRPTEGTGSAGSLKATERHLADMRELVFSKFGQPVLQAQQRASP